MNLSLKEDNKEILSQLDKMNKRIRQLESERDRNLDLSKQKDLTIADLTD